MKKNLKAKSCKDTTDEDSEKLTNHMILNLTVKWQLRLSSPLSCPVAATRLLLFPKFANKIKSKNIC